MLATASCPQPNRGTITTQADPEHEPKLTCQEYPWVLLHIHITNLTEFLFNQSHLRTQQNTEFYEIHFLISWHWAKPSQRGIIWSTIKQWSRSFSKAHCKTARESLKIFSSTLSAAAMWVVLRSSLGSSTHLATAVPGELWLFFLFYFPNFKKEILLEKLKTSTVKEKNIWQMRFLASSLPCSKALKRGSHGDAQLIWEFFLN